MNAAQLVGVNVGPVSNWLILVGVIVAIALFGVVGEILRRRDDRARRDRPEV